MLNINQGKNRELMDKCKTLKEYSAFVSLIRAYAEEKGTKEAVHCAVEECIKKNILRDFLIEQKAEVIAVSIFEYDEEKELEKPVKRLTLSGTSKDL